MADLPQHHQGPLVTIDFAWADVVEQRHWHHVPRIGDHVALDLLSRRTTDDDAPPREGVVVGVRWRENGSVVLALKGSDE